jgi:hydroxymethylbilane synthase
MTSNADPPLRLGTRGSPLAIAQAELTRAALAPLPVEIVRIATAGDIIQDRPLAEIGGKALWTKAIDRALLDGDIDLAVHSLKDVETLRPDAIVLGAVLPRADVRDRLIGANSIAALGPGARVGTSSPRRAAQLLRIRRDLDVVGLRGNVATRMMRVADGTVAATLLAAAGLDRLGQHEVGTAIDVDTLLPAASQGAIGIEVRRDDAPTLALLVAIDDAPTRAAVLAERALLAALGADCHSPVAAYARVVDGALLLTAELLSGDGRDHVRDSIIVDTSDAPALLAERLLAAAPAPLANLFCG